MAELSAETIELLERARRAIEEAERLRTESRVMAAIARQRGYIVHPRERCFPPRECRLERPQAPGLSGG
jgi:hypothetical protein